MVYIKIIFNFCSLSRFCWERGLFLHRNTTDSLFTSFLFITFIQHCRNEIFPYLWNVDAVWNIIYFLSITVWGEVQWFGHLFLIKVQELHSVGSRWGMFRAYQVFPDHFSGISVEKKNRHKNMHNTAPALGKIPWLCKNVVLWSS